MILAYRVKTGCKQYVFEDHKQMRDYFKKKWYEGEEIHFYVYCDKTKIQTLFGQMTGGKHETIQDEKT